MDALACRPALDGAGAAGLVLSDSLGAAAEITAAVHRGVPMGELLELVAVKIAQTTGHSMALVMEPDPTRGAFVVVASSGVSEEYVDDIARHPVMTTPGDRGEAPTSRAFRSRRPVVASTPHIAMPPEWERRADGEGIRSMLSLPLLTHDGVGYVVNVYCGVRHCFGEQAILAAENLTSVVSLLIDLRRREDEHRAEVRTQRQVVHALEATCRARRVVLGHVDALHRLVAGGAPLDRVLAEICALTDSALEVSDGYGRVLARAGSLAEGVAEEMHRELIVDGDVVGTLRVLHVPGPTPRTETAGILHTAPSLISLVLQRQWAAMDVEARLRGGLVEELLSAPGVSESDLVAHARARWGIDLGAPAWLIVARLSDVEGPLRPGRTLQAAAENLVRRSPSARMVAEHNQHLVALCEGSSADTARDFAEALRRELAVYAGDKRVSVAVGGRCDTIAGHRDSHRQALALLDLISASDDPGRTVAADDFGLARLFLGLKDPRDLVAFAGQTLGPVRAYDARRNAGLMETLQTYLDTGCNAQETAKILHLHHNSVGYRLKRITEILHLANLSEPRVLLRLELAMSVIRLTGLAAPAATPDHSRSSDLPEVEGGSRDREAGA